MLCHSTGTYSNGFRSWLGLSLLCQQINFAGVIKHKNKTNYWGLKWLAKCTVKIVKINIAESQEV